MLNVFKIKKENKKLKISLFLVIITTLIEVELKNKFENLENNIITCLN
jgi:hypothetical protein